MPTFSSDDETSSDDALRDVAAIARPRSVSRSASRRKPMRAMVKGSVEDLQRSMSDKHIPIIGSGSVGKRHARNLSALGCRISCVDPRAERRDELAQETAIVGSFADEKRHWRPLAMMAS